MFDLYKAIQIKTSRGLLKDLDEIEEKLGIKKMILDNNHEIKNPDDENPNTEKSNLLICIIKYIIFEVFKSKWLYVTLAVLAVYISKKKKFI